MFRNTLIVACCFCSPALAQNITITSAASPFAGFAPESLATVTGTNLAAVTATATTQPWPTTLGGVTIFVSDSALWARPAGLLLVSPTQINFQFPVGTALGQATLSIAAPDARFSVPVLIQRSAPGLFSVNQLGFAAATAIRVVLATQIQSPIPVFRCTAGMVFCQLVPISLGVDTPIYLSFFGTGIRGRSSLANVRVMIGTVEIAPTYAGPQGRTPGLDQVNVPLVLSLRGAGVVNVTVTVDGVRSNPVRIEVQ